MASPNDFPLMTGPVSLGHLTLSSRVVMGSMHTGLEDRPGGFARLAAFYRQRAQGGVGLVITGGISPNEAGAVFAGARNFASAEDAEPHRQVTEAVHEAGGHIALQLLHTGRYGYHPECVAPSALKAPINPLAPRALSPEEIAETIRDFARAARLARDVGYDGVEIMGSEGYLLNQFVARRTNRRDDEWGGDFERRIRFPTEVVRAVREAVGERFLVIFRLSLLDLVEEGSTFEETVTLAHAVSAAGADVLNTGIGWHEARVPTIAMMVPRAAFTWATARFRSRVDRPVVASNRINTPEVAEGILARGEADLVSLARPLLADAHFVRKAAEGRRHRIDTCIACNQACLDRIFQLEVTSCLVNPMACRETELQLRPAATPRRVAVVGSGPAGLACATAAAERGHEVTLFEARERIGGQLNLAVRIPGKEEFHETLRYFGERIRQTGVRLELQHRATAEDLLRGDFDAVVLATGVRPRRIHLPGQDHPGVLGYLDLLERYGGSRLGEGIAIGPRVAVVGAGGIGFDVAEWLTSHEEPTSLDRDRFLEEWGIDTTGKHPGGLLPGGPRIAPSARRVYLCQRRSTRPGKDLGKTTGWIHRAHLRHRRVEMLAGVQYRHVDSRGLHIVHEGRERILEVDHVVICAGQEPLRPLEEPLREAGMELYLVGGAREAGELDAERAVREGTERAAEL